MLPADFWIERLQLTPHPEGGYYRETYRCRERIDPDGLPARYSGPRHMGTAIYFMLTSGSFSSFHRLKSDEAWHFYTGHPITLHRISPKGKLTTHLIGNDPMQEQEFQVLIPANEWFAAEVVAGGEYGLVGCTVAPGFDFEDFEMATRPDLLTRFPQHEGLIRQFTRE
jgi:hypothetical protein